MDSKHGAMRCLRQCGLDLRSVLSSRLRGRLDGARLDGSAADLDPHAAELVTPYVHVVRRGAERATAELRGRLLHDRRALVARIHSGAVAVVTQYEVRRSPSPALLDRWGRSVAEWRTEAAHCRSRAESVVGVANLRLAHYWDAVWRRLPSDRTGDTRPQDWLPGAVTLGADWSAPDSWLTAAPDASSALTAALRVLDGPQEPARRHGGRAA